MAKISVIVPVYKVESYLHRCVDSILAQTYRDFELILVDDGSPDGCPDICEEYAAKDSRVKVIHQKNAGVSAARNAALDFASGEYIAFCDGDDYWDKEWLNVLFERANETNADVVGAGILLTNENGQILRTRMLPDRENNFESEENLKKYLIVDMLYSDLGWEVCSRLFKREIIADRSIRFCVSCHNFAEDLGFLLEYMLFCQKAVSTSYCGYYYVQHATSMMNSSKTAVKLDAVNEISALFYRRLTRENRTGLLKMMPCFHYMIMWNQYQKLVKTGKRHKIKEELLKIQNQQYYFQLTKQILENKDEFVLYLGKGFMSEAVLFSNYCVTQTAWNYDKFMMVFSLHRTKHRFGQVICRLLGEKNFKKLKFMIKGAKQ